MKKNTVIAFAVGAVIGGIGSLVELARECTTAKNARVNRDFLHKTFNEWEDDEDKRWTAPE